MSRHGRLADRLFELGWLRRRQTNRSVEITTLGETDLRSEFGLELKRIV